MDNLKSMEVRMSGKVVGKLALTSKGLCAFQYGAEWLEGGFSISPFELPLRNDVFVAKQSPFDGIFGVFDDCLPDGWGLLIMDRYLQKQGLNPLRLNILDRLALVGANGRGALEFYPDRSVTDWSVVRNFGKLAEEVSAILGEDGYVGFEIEELYKRGGSPGGARPKVFVRYDDAEWLVKFRAKNDPENVGCLELKYADLAKSCGVEMTECRLFEDRYFGTKRFDRSSGGGKIHVVSAAGLLCADYRIPCMDYLHLFQVAAKLTHSVKELWKIYRLMCFNYLIGNKDDHAKNFAFIHLDDGWHFAPAFDILPSDGFGGYHTTSFNDSITPNENDLISIAKKVGLDDNEAVEILNEMKRACNA